MGRRLIPCSFAIKAIALLQLKQGNHAAGVTVTYDRPGEAWGREYVRVRSAIKMLTNLKKPVCPFGPTWRLNWKLCCPSLRPRWALSAHPWQNHLTFISMVVNLSVIFIFLDEDASLSPNPSMPLDPHLRLTPFTHKAWFRTAMSFLFDLISY